MKRKMHLGLFLHGTGSHIAGWRPTGAIASNQDFEALKAIVLEAERAKFDMVFVGDSLSSDPYAHPSYAARLEPLTLLAALAASGTKFIGLAATASTTYCAPYTIARAFASLDHISGGRAAWNAVTTTDAAAAANYGVEHPNHAQRYQIAGEFIDIVKGLWDCWEDDAIVADRQTGTYIDPEKVRPLGHEGQYFKVKGPLNIGRSPQGRPIVIQAGGSEAGRALAARVADVVFSVVQDFGEAQKDYAALKSLVEASGRPRDAVTVMPGVMPVVAKSDKEALEKLNMLQSFVDNKNGIHILSDRLGIDLTDYNLDGPIPEAGSTDTSHAFARAILSKARRENMSLRDVYNLVAASRGHWVLCGSPETIATTLIDWFENGAADGFNVMPAYFIDQLTEFADQVVPILQEKGVFRKEYTGRTLRDHFGLERAKRNNALPLGTQI
ncbi:LLM class flavin-dependent oxidoreductase [Aminobacter ciceronei]|uniref:FMN-dependent oxidoreductase (Nitrilotriacetate monooxygenase family) n=1 Tax=Aminobacter ciceronei TaxID=150723 RepID=A0ABR6CF88_9HYPH|nr:LLM class flavin-dependent oxidoreductase [Aminobacter ciceronei]MBA8909942.1 FMN-dependent oxidoreductase (nitrilotriacetate monooxygenase family) [Aminobacter ciceronei]MBA9023714.1 FMN-dependent oxidoreductase (nitrilotriacetate monooxygenase family) [Aminobacter ciceronei]